MPHTSFRAAPLALALLILGALLVPPIARAASTAVEKDKPLASVPLRSEFVVAVNAKGEVVRVVSRKSSKNPRFDVLTYGNAVQTYIRTDTGRVVLGTFRLVYTYNPKRDSIRRDVALVSRGGVDPNAESAVSVMEKRAAEYTKRDAEAMQKYMEQHAASPESPLPLPPLHEIVGSPTPIPAH